MADDTGLKVQKAVISLRHYGLDARIPDSGDIHSRMLDEWRANPGDARTEYLWRVASLVHGAMLAKAGKWNEAVDAYFYGDAPRPLNSPMRPPDKKCARFAALMAVGEAVARIHCQDPYAASVAEIGAGGLAGLNDPRYARWAGVSMLIIAIEQQNPDVAKLALQCICPHRQPELRTLADMHAGQGNGTIGRWFGRRKANFTAQECLYLFNHPQAH